MDVAAPKPAHLDDRKSIASAAASLPSPPPSRAASPPGVLRQERPLVDSSHISLIVAGWADASSGPLIPYIQSHFGISYTVVSMLFVGSMGGSMLAGFVNDPLSNRFGMGRVIVLGAIAQIAAYALLLPTFPFPAFPCFYVLSGFGVALQDAQANAWVATLPNAERKLSFIHASYGLGAAVSPLAATAFTSAGILFSRFYAVSLGLGVLNICVLLYAFRFSFRIDFTEPTSQQPAPVAAGEAVELDNLGASSPHPSTVGKLDAASQVEEGRAPSPPLLDTAFPAKKTLAEKKKRENAMWQAASNRTFVSMALFLFLYVGSEVSMGGWIVTFLLDNRNGGPDVGYVASGYWLGIVVGRLAFIPVTAWIGERTALFVYTACAFALEFVIWFRDDLIGNAVTVGLIGCLMGPSYP
ncbi:hypothetical protein JCM8547_003661, partial [Rhodosporidiobolus lusitaniae]